MKPLVYVAGPYTHPDPAINVHDTILAAQRLWDTGLMVPVVPHLTHLWHLIAPQPYERWLEYDNELLARCDALYRLPGESAGADKEVERAVKHLGIPVFHRSSDGYQALLAFCRTWTPAVQRLLEDVRAATH